MTLSDIASRTALAHPAFLTLACIAAWLVSTITPLRMDLTPIGRGVVWAAPFAVSCFWHWAIFSMARTASGYPPSARAALLFMVPPTFAVAAIAAGWPTGSSATPAGLTFFALFSMSAWCAAQALENAAAGGVARVGRVVASAGQMWISYLGVWLLWATIRRVGALRGASA